MFNLYKYRTLIINVKSHEFVVYNYVNFINIFYDKELQILNYINLHAFILTYCGLYITLHTLHSNTFKLIFHIF